MTEFDAKDYSRILIQLLWVTKSGYWNNLFPLFFMQARRYPHCSYVGAKRCNNHLSTGLTERKIFSLPEDISELSGVTAHTTAVGQKQHNRIVHKLKLVFSKGHS